MKLKTKIYLVQDKKAQLPVLELKVTSKFCVKHII